MEGIIERFREFLATPEGLTYLARRVRVGAKAQVAEAIRLEAWLKERSVFDHQISTERGERK